MSAAIERFTSAYNCVHFSHASGLIIRNLTEKRVHYNHGYFPLEVSFVKSCCTGWFGPKVLHVYPNTPNTQVSESLVIQISRWSSRWTLCYTYLPSRRSIWYRHGRKWTWPYSLQCFLSRYTFYYKALANSKRMVVMEECEQEYLWTGKAAVHMMLALGSRTNSEWRWLGRSSQQEFGYRYSGLQKYQKFNLEGYKSGKEHLQSKLPGLLKQTMGIWNRFTIFLQI